MKFDWDPRKSRTNQKKHGVAFDEAITAFDDPFALIAPDPQHSQAELREWLIGAADSGVLVVVFTRREQGQVWRIISARRANRKERAYYEECKRIPI